jgi:hypothetical protein
MLHYVYGEFITIKVVFFQSIKIQVTVIHDHIQLFMTLDITH